MTAGDGPEADRDDPGRPAEPPAPVGPKPQPPEGTHRIHGYWLVAIALTAAAAFALAVYAVATYALDVDLHIIPTVTTALVIGAFLSLILARPRPKKTTFDVKEEED